MAKKRKRDNAVPASEIPEVAAFEEVKQRLQAFRESNPDFFQFLEGLIEEYNDKLDAASKATKSKQVSCGDFDLYQWSTKFDAQVLYQALGHQKFLACGGKVNTVTQYEVDRTRMQSAIDAGVVPKDIADAAVSRSPRFHKPDKLVMP